MVSTSGIDYRPNSDRDVIRLIFVLRFVLFVGKPRDRGISSILITLLITTVLRGDTSIRHRVSAEPLPLLSQGRHNARNLAGRSF